MTFMKFLIPPVIFALSFAGCGNSKQTKELPTISYWRPKGQSEAYYTAYSKFAEKHPEAKFVFRTIDEDKYEKELVDALAKGQGPDVFALRSDKLIKHKAKLYPAPEVYIDVNSYINNLGKSIVSDLYFDNKLYGLPMEVESLSLFINPNLLKDKISNNGMPLSWNRLIELAKNNTKFENGKMIQSGLAIGSGQNVDISEDILSLIMLQKETQMTTPDHRQAAFHLFKMVDNKDLYPGREALQFYADFANLKSDHYTYDPALGNSLVAFTKGKAAMMLNYPSMMNFLNDTMADVEDVRIGQAPNFWTVDFPTTENRAGVVSDPIDYLRYYTEVVNVNSKNRDFVWSMLDEFSSTIYLTPDNGSPFILEDKDKFGKRLPVNYAKTWFKGAFPEETDMMMRRMADDVVKTKKSVEEVINAGAEAETNLLQQTINLERARQSE